MLIKFILYLHPNQLTYLKQTIMKKTILLLAVATAFCFASCKKDYTCTCKATGYSGTISGKAKSNDATKACEDEQTRLKDKGYSDASCSL